MDCPSARFAMELKTVHADDWLRVTSEPNGCSIPTLAITSGILSSRAIPQKPKTAQAQAKVPQAVSTLKWKVMLYNGANRNGVKEMVVNEQQGTSPTRIWSSALQVSPRQNDVAKHDERAGTSHRIGNEATAPGTVRNVRQTAASFSPDKGVLLRHTYAPYMRNEDVAKSGPQARKIPDPRDENDADHRRPNTAPSTRDMRYVKRLIRMVQFETGEAKHHIDTRVLQSLIPTAARHPPSKTKKTKTGLKMETANPLPHHQQALPEDQAGIEIPPVVVDVASAPKRPRTAEAKGFLRNSQKSLSPPKGALAAPFSASQSVLKPSIVTATNNGSLALGGGQSTQAVDEAEVVRLESSTRPSPPRANYVPRPQSAKVARPSFTYQRTFDGHATLESYTRPEMKFFHFSADTVPVVGRH